MSLPHPELETDEPAVTIRTRRDGPLVVEGPVRVVDAEGNEFALPTDKPMLALCRCGHSQRKPFCDGAHRETGFSAADRAPS